MTNTATTSRDTMTRSFARTRSKTCDQAPMVVTRLSGWIDVGDGKAAAPSWIVPTKRQFAIASVQV